MLSISRMTSLVGLICVGISLTIAGSGQRTGTNGAAELLIPTGTRDIALAGATVASSTGVDALFWNPAGSARARRDVMLSASHMDYISDIGVECGAVSVQFEGFGALSLQLKALSVGDIPLTTVETPDGTGQTFKPQFLTIGLTYARLVTDRVSVGVTGTVISERLAEVSASGFAFTAGVRYEALFGVSGFDFGVAVKNIGPQMKFEGPGLTISAISPDLTRGSMMYKIDAAGFELPSTIEIGLGYRATVFDGSNVLLAASFENSNFADDSYRVGLEYGYRELLFLRGGYNFQPPESDQRENIFGPAFGMGVHLIVGNTDVAFDYAFRTARFFDSNHVFSLTVGL